MQNHTTSPAVRRFYTFFYQWSRLQRGNHQLNRAITNKSRPRQRQSDVASPARRISCSFVTQQHLVKTNRRGVHTAAKAEQPENGVSPSGSRYEYAAEFWVPFRLFKSREFHQLREELQGDLDVGVWEFELKLGSKILHRRDPNKVVMVRVPGSLQSVQRVREALNQRLFPDLLPALGLPTKKLEKRPGFNATDREKWIYTPLLGEKEENVNSEGFSALNLPGNLADLFDMLRNRSAPFTTSSAQALSSESEGLDPQDEIFGVLESHKLRSLVLGEQVKAVCRTLTYPVVVITTHIRRPGAHVPEKALCRAVTVSSFATVAFSPRKFATFNLQTSSRTLKAMKRTHKIVVHVLAATPSGARLASVFTRPRNDPAEPFLNGEVGRIELDEHWRTAPKLTGIWDEPASNESYGDGPDPGRNGAVIARIECILAARRFMTVGDHTVVYAEITNVERLDKNGQVIEIDPQQHMSALSYGDRRYRTMGQVLEAGAANEAAQRIVRGKQVEEGQINAHKEDLDIDTAVEDHCAQISEAGCTTNAAEGRDPSTNWSRKNQGPTNPAQKRPQTIINPSLPRHTGMRRQNYSTTASISSSQKLAIASVLKQKVSSFIPHLTLGPNTPWNKIAKEQAMDEAVTHSTEINSNESPSVLWSVRIGARRRRVVRLLKLRKESEEAAKILNEQPNLPAADRARLENQIIDAEREITKTVALRCADELNAMLDSGSGLADFDPSGYSDPASGKGKWGDVSGQTSWVTGRYNWLEANVERGLAVLLEEAKELRSDFDGNRITGEAFEASKSKLAKDHASLEMVSLRLRSFTEDEDDSGDF